MAIGVANGVFFANYKKQAWFTQSSEYFERVTLDLGAVRSQQAVKGIYKFLDSEGLYTDTKLLWFGDAGIKTRVTSVSSTPLTFVSKGYSIQLPANDLTQTTELDQPYLSGNIAPNERYGVKSIDTFNSKILNFPIISFSESDFSLTYVFNQQGNNRRTWNAITRIFDGVINHYISLGSTSPGHSFVVTINGNNFTNSDLKKYYGKNTSITITNNIISNEIKLFINGEHIQTIANNISLFRIFNIFGSFDRNVIGTVLYHRIQSGAMTAPQVAAEHAMLRSIYPEIESVQIGTQTWATSNLEMVATPMGNEIPEVQLNSAEEKITNIDDREFNSDTGWWDLRRTSITSGVGRFLNSSDKSWILRVGLATVGRSYKITFTVLNYINGGVRVSFNKIHSTVFSANGTYTVYLRADNTNPAFVAVGDTTLDIDNVSIQELGWVDRTELYNGLIAQGMSVADATKECAAWCYYNNDPNIGAVYGKLYNWYAAKLIQNDIDAYNVANPSIPWGWRVPVKADFDALAVTLGGTAVAGGKMKVAGTDYWSSESSGADNSSGFSGIGGGIRSHSDGSFSLFKIQQRFWGIDYRLVLSRDSDGIADVPFSSLYFTQGQSIRLIKDE